MCAMCVMSRHSKRPPPPRLPPRLRPPSGDGNLSYPVRCPKQADIMHQMLQWRQLMHHDSSSFMTGMGSYRWRCYCFVPSSVAPWHCWLHCSLLEPSSAMGVGVLDSLHTWQKEGTNCFSTHPCHLWFHGFAARRNRVVGCHAVCQHHSHVEPSSPNSDN